MKISKTDESKCDHEIWADMEEPILLIDPLREKVEMRGA